MPVKISMSKGGQESWQSAWRLGSASLMAGLDDLEVFSNLNDTKILQDVCPLNVNTSEGGIALLLVVILQRWF